MSDTKSKIIAATVEPAITAAVAGVASAVLMDGDESIPFLGMSVPMAVPYAGAVFVSSLVAESIKQAVNKRNAVSVAISRAVKPLSTGAISAAVTYMTVPVTFTGAIRLGGIAAASEVAGTYSYDSWVRRFVE